MNRVWTDRIAVYGRLLRLAPDSVNIEYNINHLSEETYEFHATKN